MIIFLVAAIIFLHTCLVWLWYRYTNNPSVVDVGWASGLTIAGLVYLNDAGWTFRTVVLGLALLIWGVRLGGYLWYTRIRHKEIDKRYIALSDNWKIAKPLGFFINFQLQGIFILIISFSWYFTSIRPATSLSVLDIIGLVVFVIALLLEIAADAQLTRFRKQYPGQVCNQNLWQYSRHPNYFFEWLVWCAFALFAFSLPYGWLSIISPLTLYFIMTRLTAPLTEQGSIKSRGEAYIQYQKVTPMFFPKCWRSRLR